MPDSNAAPTPSTDPPQEKWKTFLGLIPIILILGFVAFGLLQSLNSASNAKAGECLTLNESNKTDPYTKGDCNDNDVKYKIYSIKDTGAQCVEVPGTSRTVSLPSEQRSLCIGEKNVDLAKTINDVDTRDCVIVTGDKAEKVSCQANMSRPVLGVLKDVLKGSEDFDGIFGNECLEQDAEDTNLTYSWGLETQNTGIKTLAWDRVICLGEELAV